MCAPGQRHPNLLLFMGWCPDPPLIATEFMRRGSLHNILRRAAGALDGPRLHHAATCVARGRGLHSSIFQLNLSRVSLTSGSA